MATKSFAWVVALLVALGAGSGGVAFALVGGADGTTPVAAAAGNQAGQLAGGRQGPGAGAPDVTDDTGAVTASDEGDDTPQATPTPGTAGPGGGQRPGAGGFGGAAAGLEPISGVVLSIDATGVVLTSSEGPVDVAVAADAPVRLSKTAVEAANDLAPGVEITAVLARQSDGTVSASNINVGGAAGGALGGLGGVRRGQDGGAGRAAGFNAVTGTIGAFSDGLLLLDTADGRIEVTVGDDTTVQLQRTFAEATADLGPDTEVTIIGRRSEDGTFEPITIATGALALQGGGFGGRRGLGGQGRQGGG